jgi:transcription-repair coupling factor (superfamily II helicase)
MNAEVLEAAATGPVAIYGATVPYCALVAAQLAERDAGLVVMVVPDESTARQIAGDLALFLPAQSPGDPAAPPRALRVSAIDIHPYSDLSPDRAALLSRITSLYRLAEGKALLSRVVVCSASSLHRLAIPPDELLALTHRLVKGQELDRDGTAEMLIRAGYARVSVVEDPGTFAVRGGVIDVYPPLYAFPARVELFGDEIETIRSFDPQTQRTLRELGEIYLHPARDTVATRRADVRIRILAAADQAVHPSAATRQLLEAVERGDEFVGIDTLTPAFHAQMVPLSDYFTPHRPRYFTIDTDGVLRAAAEEREQAEKRYEERLADHRIAFPPHDHYASLAELERLLTTTPNRVEARRLELHQPELNGTTAIRTLRVAVDDNHNVRAELERARRQKADELIRPLVDALERWRHNGWKVAIACDSSSRRERLLALLAEYGEPAQLCDLDPLRCEELVTGGPVALVRGNLSAGFALPAERRRDFRRATSRQRAPTRSRPARARGTARLSNRFLAAGSGRLPRAPSARRRPLPGTNQATA